MKDARVSSNRSSQSWIRLRSGVVGAAVFCLTQIPLLLLTADRDGITNPGWFLNSGRNVLIMAIALAVGAAVLSATTTAAGATPVSYGIGASVAMIVVLFAIGPGNIFPIVHVFGGAVIAWAVACGYGCIQAVRALRRLAR